MKQIISTGFVLLACLACAQGCGESKPDPTKREGFVDTTDPSKVTEMNKLPPPGAGGGQK